MTCSTSYHFLQPSALLHKLILRGACVLIGARRTTWHDPCLLIGRRFWGWAAVGQLFACLLLAISWAGPADPLCVWPSTVFTLHLMYQPINYLVTANTANTNQSNRLIEWHTNQAYHITVSSTNQSHHLIVSVTIQSKRQMETNRSQPHDTHTL